MSEHTTDTAEEPLLALVAATVYAPEEIPGPVAVVVGGRSIRAVWRVADAAEARRRVATLAPGVSIEVQDLEDARLAPGYIDLHVHGSFGRDITSGAREDMEAMTLGLPGTGVTSFFPTMATTGRDETVRQVRRLVETAARQPDVAAEILGIRLEGPFISRAKKGAQYEPAIRPPDPTEMGELAAIAGGLIRIVDFAPEEDHDLRLLVALVRLGILPCIGHTDATYEQAIEAIDAGARHCTHLFNAMPPLGHRAPGVAGALLTDRRATVEIIADGIHLHPDLLKLTVAARGARDVALITDAVGAAGLADGEYDFINQRVIVADGAVRLADGTLAGSALTLDRAVRNMVNLAGVTWSEAIQMATETPARIAGFGARKGAIRPGADADLVELDAGGFVQRTWVRGKLAFSTTAESAR